MERLGGEPELQQQQLPVEELVAPAEAPNESWDERVIREGIEAAVTDGRPIDHRTARYIASQLHAGQHSALYALASSGAVQPEVFGELDQDRTEQPDAVRRWVACLTVYCAARTDTGPIADWVAQAEAGDRLDLMRRISAAGVTTLGGVAIVHTPEAEADDEADDFPWSDAATWTPPKADEAAVDDVRVRSGLSEEQFDSLFAGDADEETGDMNDLGWFGMVRWPDRSGGLVLKVDSDGNRSAWLEETAEELDARWTAIRQECEQYEAESDAYGLAIAPAGQTTSGLHPRIWVGSLADYNAGHLHAEWFDALLEPEQLALATKFMLRSSRIRGAEEWGIFDYDEFYGVKLGEYESFETVAKVAQGLAEHGEPYGHWVEHVGSDSERVDQFEDHFRGEWHSFRAYLEDYLDGCGLLAFLDHVADELRPYVEVDYDALARDWESDFHVVENGRGGVWVYEADS